MVEEQQVTLNTTEKLMKIKHAKKRNGFIKGPIPLLWIAEVCKLSKSAIKVALAICFLRGIHGDVWFKLGNSTVSRFCLTRQSKSSGLRELEQAGLIQIKRIAGSLPSVKVSSWDEIFK